MQEDQPKTNIYDLPEVPFHELPPGDPAKFHKPLRFQCKNGSVVEVWSAADGDGFLVNLRKPLEDGRQSLLKFGISKEAAFVLCVLLDMKLHPQQEGKETT